ncbi:MAG TPA: DNA-binding transcriptional regulator Fis [Gammaproteobacteria bacterium]|nr:DNA-binding transcriptional regulator Fis [Gammaproteobacteria bacterium]
MSVIESEVEESCGQATFTERRQQPLSACITAALERYFHDLDGHEPQKLYEMVIAEVEQPMLKVVMKQARGNQCRAAEILGINRGTLRKKLEKYKLL